MVQSTLQLPPQTISSNNPAGALNLPVQQPSTLPGLPAPNNITQNYANAAANPNLAVAADPISFLNNVILDGTEFPVISFEEVGSHDLAVHKYPNIDAARIENTGRNPLELHITGVFTNNIFPSPRESWKAGLLFPVVFSAVLTSLYKTTPLVLQHPYIGKMNVMVHSWSYRFIAKGPRDGVFLDLICAETIVGTLASTVSVPSPTQGIANTGSLIDNTTATLPPSFSPPNLSISGMFAKISGLVSQIASFPSQSISSLDTTILQINTGVQGIVSPLYYTAGQTIQSAQTAYTMNKNLVAHGPIANGLAYNSNPLSSPPPMFNAALTTSYVNAIYNVNNSTNANANQVLNNIVALVQASIMYYQAFNLVSTAQLVQYLYQYLYQLQQVIEAQFASNTNNYQINQYYVSTPTSLFALSKVLNNDIDDIIQLNQNLGTSYLVPSDAIIAYYQAN